MSPEARVVKSAVLGAGWRTWYAAPTWGPHNAAGSYV
jgi:hypothetical protein